MTESGTPSGPPPGWYGDPGGMPVQRWWSGRDWTEHTQPAPGQPASAPFADQPQARQNPLKRSHWVRSVLTGIGGLVIAGIIINALSGGSSSGSSGTCTSGSCIAAAAESLKGTVAKDNSVMTKVTCQASTAKQVVAGTYTVNCTVTYSDGSVWDGIASVLTGSGGVDWEPTNMVSAGNSGY